MGDVSPRTYFDRQMKVAGWGSAGQDRLASAKVLVVGVGGLGCPASAALARAGVGTLVLADPDRVEVSNLPRQTLFNPSDQGLPKVEVARRVLSETNPWLTIKTHLTWVDRSNVRGLIESIDLVIEGTDSLDTKFLVHDACRTAGKPLILGALHQWEYQTTVLRFDQTETPCWRCLYPEAPHDGCVGVCGTLGVAGALAGTAGNVLALLATRILLGLKVGEPGTTTVFDGTDGSTKTFRWRHRRDCECAHARGNWSWLSETSDHGHQPPGFSLNRETIVVDLRDSDEIKPGEWEWFEARGGKILHRPWSQWDSEAVTWSHESEYLLVCAAGTRSRLAQATLPQGINVRSLDGGIRGLAIPHTIK